jgi:hypothetical protein
MSSRNTTPFIPPLNVDPSPRPPGPPPLPPQESPEWSTPPLVPGNFSHYPSPYAAPGFLPPQAGAPPNLMPGSYIPAPSQLPPADWPGQQAPHAPWANTWAGAPPTVYNNFTQSLSPPPPGFMPITPAQAWGGLPAAAYNSQGPPPQFGMMPMQGPWPGQAAGPAIGKSLGGLGLGAPAVGKSLGGAGLGPHGYGPQLGPGYGPPPGVGLGGPAGLGPAVGVGLGGAGLPAAVGVGLGPGLGPHGGIEGPSTRRPLGEDFPLGHFAIGRHCMHPLLSKSCLTHVDPL